MPDDEGLALHDGRVSRPRALGPLLEIGTYCGKSAIYLGAAARARRDACCSPSTTTAGRRRTRRAGSTTTTRLVDPRTGRMDTLPFFRRTIEDAGLEDVVVAVSGIADGRRALGDAARARVHRRRPRVRRRARRLRGLGAARRAGRRCSSFHDVFEDPGRRRSGAVRGVAARRRRRLRPRLDDRQPPRPAPLTREPASTVRAVTPVRRERQAASAARRSVRSRRRRRGARRR